MENVKKFTQKGFLNTKLQHKPNHDKTMYIINVDYIFCNTMFLMQYIKPNNWKIIPWLNLPQVTPQSLSLPRVLTRLSLYWVTLFLTWVIEPWLNLS